VTARPSTESLLGISLLAPVEPNRLQTLLAEPLVEGWRASIYPEYRLPGWSWLELFSQRANKAEACRRVIALWGERHSCSPSTVAIGDAPDDVGMFGAVEESYCPADASEKARRAASEVLPVAAGDGFARAVAARLAGGADSARHTRW
jgi:hydroxymethylpyrimidine pyrophosphatase-like HAD family hydrolase